MGRFREALDGATDLGDLAKQLSSALAKGGKAEFAMELLYSNDIDAVKVPAYIDNGLLWLAEQLKRKEDGIAGKMPLASIEATADAAKDIETEKVAA